MARATRTPAQTRTETVEVSPESFTLDLSRDEALAVLTVTGRIAGRSGLRSNVGGVYRSLEAAGLSFWDDENEENRDAMPHVLASDDGYAANETRKQTFRDLEFEVDTLKRENARLKGQVTEKSLVSRAVADTPILDLLKSNRKILAIKRARRLFDLTLLEAKNLVESTAVVDAAHSRGTMGFDRGYLDYLVNTEDDAPLAEWEWSLIRTPKPGDDDYCCPDCHPSN